MVYTSVGILNIIHLVIMSAIISLFLISSLIHVTTCNVYTVTPDDDDDDDHQFHHSPNTTCHHCHNLQYYLLNVTKYFTSNTQLLFLPRVHHLHTNLIIQNVRNISIIGSTAIMIPHQLVLSNIIQQMMV